MATRTVVFDMDGTLVQTRAASWDVFQDTARRFELPIRSAEEFFELFRGNFHASLKSLCSDADVEAAVREHFLQGLRDRYAPRFIPGMRDVVTSLAAHYPLAVMSSNAMGAIRRILEAEGVAECFAHVFSGEVGSSKEAHLRRILAEPSYGDARHCSASYVEGNQRDAAEVVLITDTVGDVREARNCGVRAIGVAWGMHSSDALLRAGAEFVALWPQELLATLLPSGGCGSEDGQACQCAQSGSCRPLPVTSDKLATGPAAPFDILMPSGGCGSEDGQACRCAQSGSCRPLPVTSDELATGPAAPRWARVTQGHTAVTERGWPWPTVTAAGHQRRTQRASAAHADTRTQTLVSKSTGTPADLRHQNGTHGADPALAAALHRIAQMSS
jgi:phosphoglycolate phosphatase